MKTCVYLIVALLLATSFNTPSTGSSVAEFDLVVLGGRIVDGTGNPWYEADIGIAGGRIVEIGRIDPQRGNEVIYAQGLIVAPGFIDVHTHIEGGIERNPNAENFLQMGVTSVVTGNCGSSRLNLEEWFEKISGAGIGVNVASLIGHNTIRREAMNGDFDRPPRPDELDRMRDLVDRAMRAGAVGLSTGLEYVPGMWATTDEIAELAKVAAAYGGVYASHMRDEGEFIEKSVAEAIAIGEKARIPVEISHFKISSKKRWGASAASIKMVEDARARGLQVTVDQYLYPASSTGIGILFTSWVFDGGREKTEERLRNPATRERIRRDVIEKARAQGFSDLSFAYIANYETDQSFNGRNLAEITQAKKGRKEIEAQADLAIEILQAGGASMVLRKMSDEDVERIFRQPFTMVASDAGVMSWDDKSVPHPRGFGNNARALGLYVREKKIVSLPEAIRRMTSLPAQTFGLLDRGLIRPGMAADLVIFDENAVRDLATFEKPKTFPVGIDYVIVNGRKAVERSYYSHTNAGVILRGSTKKVESVDEATAAERALRVRDERIFTRFYRLKREKEAGLIDADRYVAALKVLREDEMKLFEDAKNVRFNNMTEHEYWHRSRLKFPSSIIQELQLIERK